MLLTCRAWSRAAAGTNTDDTPTTFGEEDGYPRWADTEKVFFFQIDGDQTTAATKYYPQSPDMSNADQLTTLVFTGADYLAFGAAAIATSVFAQLL